MRRHPAAPGDTGGRATRTRRDTPAPPRRTRPDVPDDSPPSRAIGTRPPWQRWARRLLPVAVVVLALLTVQDQIPALDQIWPVITDGDLAWIGAALAAEIISMAMFARQQQWLLRGVGVRVGIGSALAVTYTRSALAISMPAGTAVSAGFAYQSFRRWGATREASTAIMVVSGVCSFAALALLYLGGYLSILVSSPTETWQAQPVGTTVAVTVAVAVAALIVRNNLRDRGLAPALLPDADTTLADTTPVLPTPPAGDPDSPTAPPGWHQPAAWLRHQIVRGVALLRDVASIATDMPARYRTAALGFAVVNWLADLACLAAVAQAFHLPLSLFQLGTAYVVIQLVRQIPITPGGMGVIEASLLAALTAAGAEPAAATATVLGYRLLSCWLIIPAGLTTWAYLRRAAATPEPAIARPELQPSH